MKELPGAPALPEGWFYRVTSKSFGSSGRVYTLRVWRPVWFFSVPVRGTKVLNRRRMGGVYDFYGADEKPTLEHLATAAHKVCGNSDYTTTEGDYR